MSLLIRGATIVDPLAGLHVGDLRIEAGHIVEVGPGLDRGTATVLDARDLVAMPGLINAHTHSGQHLDRGVAPNLPLDVWLMWVVYGGPAFSPDDSYTLALAGAVEMLESGCTAVLDHAWLDPAAFGQHADAIMSAYADVGIRAGLAPMIQDLDIFASMSFEGVDGGAPEPMGPPLDPAFLLGEMEAFLAAWGGHHSRLTPMIGPSAPQRCSDELMAGLAELRRQRGALFHTHVLETQTQIEATHRRYGRSSVAFLEDLDLLGSFASLAHCVWMDDAEYRTVREAGATIVHNPISNLRCGSGLLPLADLLDGGVSVALGADGAASNDNQNMFEAMKFASLIHTLYGDHQRWPSATAVWEVCLKGGAAALGQPLGSLTVGSKADVVLLSSDRHRAPEADVLIRSLVLAEHGQSVQTVIVDGEVVVAEGRVATVDHRDLQCRIVELQQRIYAARADREVVLAAYGGPVAAAHDVAMASAGGLARRATITPAFKNLPGSSRP